MNKQLSITRLSAALGAEVEGLDLSELNAEQVDSIRELLHEHLVLFFPQQFLDIDAHVALGSHFGPLDSHPNLDNPFTKHPHLFELAARAVGVLANRLPSRLTNRLIDFHYRARQICELISHV